MADIPGSTSTTAVIGVGGSTSNSLEVIGDRDWYRITLTQGQMISVSLTSGDFDSYLTMHNSSGAIVGENDDGGGNLNSLLVFTAPSSGTYYIDVGSFEDAEAGAYQLHVDTYTPPDAATPEEVADQLINGYWGGDSHHFSVSEGDSLTVNLNALTSEGQSLARAALDQWSEIIGVQFVEVGSGGQIRFNDNEDGAFSNSVWSGGIISSSTVNISTQWLDDYRGDGSHNSYAFQTYVHEIGHALGLGHAGNYNETATYPNDALFANDGWPMSVMSYFDQVDSTYYSERGFTLNFVVTPMMADIYAMSLLYGLSTTTRAGDTVYGPGWNADMGALCIYDSGGTDTIDCSGFGGTALINLNAGTFSNLLGQVGNISIALGVVIEDAIGAAAADTLIGNDADNVLEGSGGNDSLSGNGGDDTLDGGTGVDALDGGAGSDIYVVAAAAEHGAAEFADSGASGTDEVRFASGVAATMTLFSGDRGIERVVAGTGTGAVADTSGTAALNINAAALLNAVTITGNAGANILTATGLADWIYGNGGNDTLNGGAGADTMAGGAGDDIYIVDNAGDSIVENGGEGTDLVQSSVTHTLAANVDNLTLTGASAINATGNAAANILTGNAAANVLSGLAGADTMKGGAGNDIYVVDNAGDRAIELAAKGIDLVQSSITFALGTEIENLTLTGVLAIDGTGNSGANILIGNGAANLLNGGGGADVMKGGAGNDTYVVSQAGDQVVEASASGTDLVKSSVSFALGANLENLTLTGTAAIDATGNAADNILIGNAAANLLNGKAGADSMTGGAGNDTYVVDNAGDQVIELASSHGVDLVLSSVSFTLPDRVENLTLTGIASIDATGNSAANLLTGNSGANTLNGGAGNDTIDGGAGRDQAYGGLGADTFTFEGIDLAGLTASTADRIRDFSQAQLDRIDLSQIDANTLLDGDQGFDFIGSSLFSGAAGELRYEQIAGNTYVTGDWNGDATADFMIRVDGLHPLHLTDFVV